MNSDNVILTTSARRADHVPRRWTANTADTGVIVNGNKSLHTTVRRALPKYEVI
jgi:hypothetical protein